MLHPERSCHHLLHEVRMSLAPTIERELIRSGLDFQLLHHPPAQFSLESARVARVAPARIGKAVLLTDGASYVLAIVPADAAVEFDQLRLQLGRPMRLASEAEASLLFHDCLFGAVPALGPAYGIETWLDERLLESPDLYFEGGDHELLVRMEMHDFLRLLHEANFGRFTRPRFTAGPRRSRPRPGDTPHSSPGSCRR